MAGLPEGPIWAAAGILTMVIKDLVKGFVHRRNGGGGDALGRILVSVEKTVTQMVSQQASAEKSMDQLVVQQSAVATALTGVTVVLTQLTGRLENLPTKVDLLEGFQASRHDLRGIVSPLALEIGELRSAIEKRKEA
jgi:hypothetical protein